MSIEKKLFSHLSTTIELINERVFPQIMPLNSEVPCVVYTIVNDQDITSLNNGVYGFDVRIQIDCYAKSYAEVKQLKDEVKKALYSFKYFPKNLNSRDILESDSKLYRQLIDFNLKG